MAAKNTFEGLMEVFEASVNDGLAAIGQQIADDMKKRIKDNDSNVDHRLSDSITWATNVAVDRSKIGSAAESGDIILKPTEKYTLYIGTQVPYAIYVEKGTGPHVTSNEMDQYEDRIREWAAKKGITDPDRVEEIIVNIRRKGTLEHPFVQPVKTDWERTGMAGRMMSKIVNDTLARVSKNWKPVEVPVTMKMGE